MPDLTVMPVAVTVARRFLLSWDEITDIVGQRVGTEMPPASPTPRFPALRLTDIHTVVLVPRRWSRMSLQVDCWGTSRSQADTLAATVVAALQEAANYQPPAGDAVLGDAEDLVARWQPDETVTPVQPRTIVTCHLPIRPNP